MPRTASRKKHIACLEGLWHDDVSRPFTVRRILQTAAELGGYRHAHLTCNTVSELEYNLRLLRRRSGFGVMYLAFHGSIGRIELPTGEVTLEELAEKMGRGFSGWVVHFGSCATVKVRENRLEAFVEATGCAMVMGYEKNVDWVESAAVDLLLFQTFQEYVDVKHMWNQFGRRYAGMVELTGLRAYLG